MVNHPSTAGSRTRRHCSPIVAANLPVAMVVVVGLGNMGLAIARRLAMRGHDLVGVDPVEDRREALRILSGKPAVATPAAVDWSRAVRVLVVVRTAEQLAETLEEVVRCAESAGCRGLPVLVVTTITPVQAEGLLAIASGAVRVVECPITGGEAPALMGTQTAMIAGPVEPEDIAFLRDSLMEEVVVFDRRGQPALAKLLNNVLCAYNLAAFGRVLAMADDRGLDPAKLRQVVVRGSGSSFSARAAVEIIGDLLAKDVGLAEQYLDALPAIRPDDIEAQLAGLRRRLRAGE